MTNGQNPGYPTQQPPWVGQPTNPNVPVQPQPGQQLVQQPQQPGYPMPPAPAQPMPVQPGVDPSAYVQPGAMVPAQPQPGQMAPAPLAPGQLPTYHIPDDAAVLAAYQQHKQEAASWGSGSKIPFVKWAGPQGQTKWDKTVPIGFEASIYVYILPPWAQGKNIFRTVKSHFWKSYSSPNGRSIGCPGSAHCLICQAKEVGLSSTDPQLQKRAKDFGRVRTQHLYNVVLLENPNAHFGQDGMMRPFVLGAGAFLHKAIGDIVEDKKGALNVVDPNRGRPIRLKRSKNGPQDMDIQYAAIAQDTSAMPPQFYPCLQNIWDLDAQDRQPSMDDMVKAVQDMGLPLPAGMPSVQPMAPGFPPQVPAQGFQPPPQTQGFQPAPAPIQPNPYPQPQQPVGDPQATTYMPPPDPFEFPPKDPVVQTTQGYPAPMPAPQPPMVAQPTQPWTPPPAQMPTQAAPPAQMPVPPPVTSQPVAVAPAPQQPVYTAQPTQAIPAPPPPGVVPPQQPLAAPQGQIPPAPPVTAPPMVAQQPTRQPVVPAPQPTTRPPCFGKANPQDRTCLECPDQLKAECFATAGQPLQAVPAQPQALTQLQNQLAGPSQ